MVKEPKKLKNEMFAVGYFEAKYCFRKSKNLRTFKDDIVNKVSDEAFLLKCGKLHNVEINEQFQHDFVEGVIEFIYELSTMKTLGGASHYNTFDLNDIVSELVNYL